MCARTVTSQAIEVTRLTDDPTWPTKRQDALAALIILQHHATRTDDPPPWLEGWGEADLDSHSSQQPAWLLDLSQHYWALYGEAGKLILQRVLRELLSSEPLH